MTTPQQLGESLRKALKNQGRLKSWLRDRLQLSEKQVTALFKGNCKVERLLQACEVLGVTLGELIPAPEKTVTYNILDVYTVDFEHDGWKFFQCAKLKDRDTGQIKYRYDEINGLFLLSSNQLEKETFKVYAPKSIIDYAKAIWNILQSNGWMCDWDSFLKAENQFLTDYFNARIDYREAADFLMSETGDVLK